MREPERGLARARFADHAERLALAHRDVDAVDGLDVADDATQEPALDREPDLEIVRRHDDRRRAHRTAADRPSARRRGDVACRGAAATVKMVSVGALLDDAALRHDADALRHPPHDAEIVGDEQDRHAGLALQLAQELQDLRLHGHVERGRRLVGDEQVGLVGERHGDHDALALAAGELVRIGAEPALGLADADLLQELQRRASAPPCRSGPGGS